MKTEQNHGMDFLCGLICYVIWGILPLYWHNLNNIDALTLLCFRIVGAAVFTVLLLALRGELKQLIDLMKDFSRMRWLAPAAVFVSANWGIYIYAMVSGNVMQASLGYYIEPLVLIAFGFLIFHERCGVYEWIAVGLAAVGALYATVRCGGFPTIALTLALSFSIYGALKKRVRVAGLISIAAETICMFPFALAYLLLSPSVQAAAPTWTGFTWTMLALAGPLTAVPLVLYTKGVNGLTLIIMGFLQFVSPTLMLISGLILGEKLNVDSLVSFAFIWSGLLFFGYAMLKKQKIALSA